MNGTEAAPFPEEEYMNGIFVALWGLGEAFTIYSEVNDLVTKK
jgi:hypothetical protein